MPMELILKSAEINLPQEIANLEALKAELALRLEKYNNLVVTEEGIKDAKAERAALNKLKTAINDQRIAAKKQYNEPFEKLEKQCKEIVALIDAPIQAIDSQIKAFDENEKQEKYRELEQAFIDLNAPEWIKIEDVLNPKWGNKTEKLDSLKAEMAKCVEKMITEFDRLMKMSKDLPAPIQFTIAQKYKECKDFSVTAVYAKQQETAYQAELRKAEEAKERELKQQMLQAAEEKKAAENVQNTPQQPEHEQSVIIPPEPQTAVSVESEQSEMTHDVKIQFDITQKQLRDLLSFLTQNKINFKRIK